MSITKVIDVTFSVYSSKYSIRDNLKNVLSNYRTLAFDCETRSIFNPEDRKEAKEYLSTANTRDEFYKQAMVAVSSSGLSYPSITRTTHFILGSSRSHSYIFVCNDEDTEMFIWEALSRYEGLLLVHNSLFDLKIMMERVRRLPKNYVDTALMVKCMINHVNTWKAKVGLKGLMGSYYNPKWSMSAGDYEPKNLKDPSFILYCAIDGASCFYLYELILDEYENMRKEENNA